MHDDDILGKAYDARLMRRLLAYLRPYWRQVAVAFVAITLGAGVALAQPYLMKIAIDQHIADAAISTGWTGWPLLYVGVLVARRSPPSTSRPGRCS